MGWHVLVSGVVPRPSERVQEVQPHHQCVRVPPPRGYPRDLEVGQFQRMIDSWDLHLRAEKKSAKTIRTYLEAAQWFAAGCMVPAGFADWDAVKAKHVQEWIITLLGRYSDSYARCGSSSSGTPPKTPTSRDPTRRPALSRRRSATSSYPSSPTRNWPRCSARARAASRAAATKPSSRCSKTPAPGCPS